MYTVLVANTVSLMTDADLTAKAYNNKVKKNNDRFQWDEFISGRFFLEITFPFIVKSSGRLYDLHKASQRAAYPHLQLLPGSLWGKVV